MIYFLKNVTNVFLSYQYCEGIYFGVKDYVSGYYSLPTANFKIIIDKWEPREMKSVLKLWKPSILKISTVVCKFYTFEKRNIGTIIGKKLHNLGD